MATVTGAACVSAHRAIPRTFNSNKFSVSGSGTRAAPSRSFVRAPCGAPWAHKQALARTRERAVLAAAVPTAKPDSQTTLGFVGMGIMGVPMALNLLKAGYKVVVWNRDPSKTDIPAQAGALVACSAKEVAETADIVFAMVSDPPAALDVATGPDGVAAGMSEGKGYVDVSTVDAATASEVAAAVRATGALFLEAPVSGSKGPAEQGALIFLTAGDEELYNAAAAPLDVMGKARFFLGEVGAGANMKLVINMIMGSMMTSLAEGLTLAKSAGLSEEQVVEVAGLGAIAAPMYALKGPSMVKREYPTAFPLKHQQKDMRLALELADDLDVDLPVAASSNAQYVSAMEAGLGDADFSAVLATVLAQSKQEG